MDRHEAGWEAYESLLGTGVALQQQVALGVLTAQAGTLRLLLGQYRAQQEAWASLAGMAFGARTGHGGVEEKETSGATGLPIGDYERLDAGELEHRLEGLTAGEVQKLRAHERRTMNRKSMMECMDRALV